MSARDPAVPDPARVANEQAATTTHLAGTPRLPGVSHDLLHGHIAYWHVTRPLFELAPPAHARSFPYLVAPPPLRFTIDPDGWWLALLRDPMSTHTWSAYVRAEWAAARVTEYIGPRRWLHAFETYRRRREITDDQLADELAVLWHLRLERAAAAERERLERRHDG
jgi:hypothetical protein